MTPSDLSREHAALLRSAIARGLVSGEIHRGTWLDIGTAERLEAANRE